MHGWIRIRTAGSAVPKTRTSVASNSFRCSVPGGAGFHKPVTWTLAPVDSLPHNPPPSAKLPHPSIPPSHHPARRTQPIQNLPPRLLCLVICHESTQPPAPTISEGMWHTDMQNRTHPAAWGFVNTTCTGVRVDPSDMCAKTIFPILRIDLTQPLIVAVAAARVASAPVGGAPPAAGELGPSRSSELMVCGR